MKSLKYEIVNRDAKQFFKHDFEIFLARSGRHYKDIFNSNKNITSVHPAKDENLILYSELITLCAKKAFLRLNKDSQKIMVDVYVVGKRNYEVANELNKDSHSYCEYKRIMFKEFAKYFAYYQKRANISPIYILN